MSNQTVVITGASTGVGFATSRRFARAGANLVLAARDGDALAEVAAMCESLGGRALVVPTDVTEEAQVERLASAADEAFGSVDVWVNNAAVTAFGRVEEVPAEVVRRVIDTNLLGYIYGTRAALPRFRRQRRGTLVSVASIAGVIPQPYASAYVASKFAVRGFMASVRAELDLDDLPEVHACTLLPGSIDTPIFQHGANFLGRPAQPMGAIARPEEVADAIFDLVRRPRRELFLGPQGRGAAIRHLLQPSRVERTAARRVDREHFAEAPAPRGAGNLYAPAEHHARPSGGWKQPNPLIPLLLFVGAGLLLGSGKGKSAKHAATARADPLHRTKFSKVFVNRSAT